MGLLQNSISRSRWGLLVRQRLEPLNLLIPIATGIHEWTPAFRDLIFDLSGYMRGWSGADLGYLAHRYRHEHQRDILRNFTDDELAVLLIKARDFELPAA